MAVWTRLTYYAVLLPAAEFVVMCLFQLVQLGLPVLIFLDSPEEAAILWREAGLGDLWLEMLFFLPVLLLWFLPAFGREFFVGAWARNRIHLFLVLLLGPLSIPLAAFLFGHWTTAVDRLWERLPYLYLFAEDKAWQGRLTDGPLERALPVHYTTLTDFLMLPSVWVGVAVAAVLLRLAVVGRRWQAEGL